MADVTKFKAGVEQLMRSGTVDWRNGIKTERGTVATDTREIKIREANRATLVFSDPKTIDRFGRLGKLLESVYRKMEDPEQPNLKFSPESYDSETLVFDLNRRRCDFNVEFETAFLGSAGEFGFAALVVHDNIYSGGAYKLVDNDGVDIIIRARKTLVWL